MKNKFIILILCFTIFFTSINYKKSYAFGGTISLPILATVVTLAVATGVALQDATDIYDVGSIFYNKYQNRWSEVQTIFNTSVALNKATNKLTIGSDFLDLVKGCFDFNFGSTVNPTSYMYGSLPLYSKKPSFNNDKFPTYDLNLSILSPGIKYPLFGDITFDFRSVGSDIAIRIYKSGSNISSNFGSGYSRPMPKDGILTLIGVGLSSSFYLYGNDLWDLSSSIVGAPSFDNPYTGGYVWDNVGSKQDKDGNVGIYVPGNLGDLVGGGIKPGDITGDVAPPWSGTGNPSLPNVDNPSIDVDKDISFPGSDVGNPDIPNVGNPSLPGVSQGITDWIISLVVPTADYWNNKFNHYSDKIASIFPIDMTIFKDICIEGKPLPDFYLTWQGQRVVFFKGTIINEFAPIARLLVQGSFAIFIAYFNYKRVMRLINK